MQHYFIVDVVYALTLQSTTALFYGIPNYSTHQGKVVGTECNEKTIYRC
jgi:hypothetical protein